MAFQAAVYEVDERLFQSGTAGPVKRQRARQWEAKLSPVQELETWRKRAEEIARNYQRLLESYRQLKANLKEQAEWRQRCNTMVTTSLRSCRDLEFALTAARESGAQNPACRALIGGIEQALENQLQQLHAHGLVEIIEPQAAELFDDSLHVAIGFKPTAELAEGLIAEVAQNGYAYGGKPVQKAKVILAAPAADDAARHELDAQGSNAQTRTPKLER